MYTAGTWFSTRGSIVTSVSGLKGRDLDDATDDRLWSLKTPHFYSLLSSSGFEDERRLQDESNIWGYCLDNAGDSWLVSLDHAKSINLGLFPSKKCRVMSLRLVMASTMGSRLKT